MKVAISDTVRRAAYGPIFRRLRRQGIVMSRGLGKDRRTVDANGRCKKRSTDKLSSGVTATYLFHRFRNIQVLEQLDRDRTKRRVINVRYSHVFWALNQLRDVVVSSVVQ